MENDFSQAPSAASTTSPSGLKKKKKSLIMPLVRAVQRSLWVIGVCTGTTTTVAWFISADDPVTYGGSFQMLVEPVTSEARGAAPSALARGETNPNDFALDYPTQVELLQSPKVLLPVFEEIQKSYPDFSYLDLRANMMISRTGGASRANQTKILQVDYQFEDPQIVEKVLNKLAEQYLTYSLEDRRTRIGEGVKFIEDQLPALQRRVNQLQAQLEQLQQRHDLVNTDSQGAEVFSRLRVIADRQTENARETQELQTLYLNLQRQLQLNPDEALAASALSQDGRYQQALTAISQIEAQIATESTRFSEQSPPILRLRERQANLTGLRDREAQRILGQTLGNARRNPQTLTFQDTVRVGLIQQLVGTRNQLQVMQTRGRLLASERMSAENAATQFPGIARRYNEIQRQLGIATRTLDQLQIQRETLRVEAAQNQVPWDIISPPLLPRDQVGNPMPVAVGSRKKLMAGFAGGIFMGLAIALLIDRFKNIFHTHRDVGDSIPAPLLGSIPRYDGIEPVSLGSLALELAEEANPTAFPFLNAFNSLYTNLCFEYPRGMLRSLVVSSATAGDGKTTTAVYLAQTAAGMGQRVLLVDANFRNPQIHNKLGLPNDNGLSDVLRLRPKTPKQKPIKQLVRAAIQTSNLVDTLFVLTAGSSTRGFSRLLASPQMKQLMDDVDEDFDLIIYDTAALNGITDATFIAGNTDGMLMVAAINQTPRSLVDKVLKQIKDYNLNLLGAIANGVKLGKPETEWEEEDEEMIQAIQIMTATENLTEGEEDEEEEEEDNLQADLEEASEADSEEAFESGWAELEQLPDQVIADSEDQVEPENAVVSPQTSDSEEVENEQILESYINDGSVTISISDKTGNQLENDIDLLTLETVENDQLTQASESDTTEDDLVLEPRSLETKNVELAYPEIEEVDEEEL